MGKAIPVSLELTERFAAKVDKSDGCWLWQGTINRHGYGVLVFHSEPFQAHRVSYTLANGPIPDGLVLDHLCRVTSCVNPEHLEAVQQRTNLLRGESPMAVARRTGYCKRGHRRDEAGVDGAGRCRRCAYDNWTNLRRRQEAADPALKEARLARQREYSRASYLRRKARKAA